MIRVKDIQEKLLHLIGWQQNYNNPDLKIADELTKSESGLYFQQVHPLLTLQNLACIAPDFANTNYPEYSPNVVYEKGDVVKYGEKLFKAKAQNKGFMPIGINFIKNASFEYFESGRENGNPPREGSTYPLDFGDGSRGIGSVAGYTSSRDARTGNHAIAVFSGVDKRISPKEPILLQPGKYEFSVYAKKRSTTTDTIYPSFKMGIAKEETRYGAIYYEYSPEAVGPTELTENYKKFTYDFEIATSVYVTPVIKITGAGFILDDISLISTSGLEYYNEFWEETNPFSEWLEDKTLASIQKAVMHFVNEKLAKGANRNILENRTLFDGTGRITDVVKNKKNIVGLELIPIRANGVTIKINKIGLQFTQPGKYTLHIWHSSQQKPVYTLEFEKKKSNSAEWFSVNDIYLPYKNTNINAGGSWYIGYAQSELPTGSQAIQKNKDWSKGPCASCSRQEYAAWAAWSKYMEIHPFFINEELVGPYFSSDWNNDFDRHGIELWDIENNQYTYNTNYGLNLDVTVSCDITDFIVEQRELFIDIIMKQFGVDMLREFAYNPNVRTNRQSINASRTDILYEIDGDSSSMKKSGLSYQLNEAFKALTISTQGLDRICLPCVNNGIRYRSI